MKRVEDPRLIRGLGTYTDDIRLPGMLHAAILRSPYAHARILGIDTAGRARDDGSGRRLHRRGRQRSVRRRAVRGVHSRSEGAQAHRARGRPRVLRRPRRRRRRRRDPYIARDAIDAIDVDYDPLPAVVNPEDAHRERARR